MTIKKHLKLIGFFKAICDAHRQEILEHLRKHQNVNVSDLVSKLKITQPTVSHHLRILSQADVIHFEKRGKEVFYSLNGEYIGKCCTGFMKNMGCIDEGKK